MADNNGKIYITISDTRGGSGKGVSASADTQTATQTDSSSDINNYVENYLFHKEVDFAKNIAKQAINFSISNIGNFTGDYYRQRDVQNVVNLAGKGATILGAGILVGKKVGGLAGIGVGLETAGLIIAGMAVGATVNYLSNSAIPAFKQNVQNEKIRDISGYSVLTNGSR